MKPSEHYKMSKQIKRLLATYTDSHKAGVFKRWAIDCELSFANNKHLRFASAKNAD